MLYTGHVNPFFCIAEPWSSNLDDLPCSKYIMNATLLSVDHNTLQGNLFLASARAKESRSQSTVKPLYKLGSYCCISCASFRCTPAHHIPQNVSSSKCS